MSIIWHFIVESSDGFWRSIGPYQFNFIDSNAKSTIQFIFTRNGICRSHSDTAIGANHRHHIPNIINSTATFSDRWKMAEWLSAGTSHVSLSNAKTNRSGNFVDNQNARTDRLCIESTQNAQKSGTKKMVLLIFFLFLSLSLFSVVFGLFYGIFFSINDMNL